ncbi:hypothetical protein BML2537_25930 [Providencia stuartii]|uniref:Uncharacterized protein n=1 Tax=Providencia stuartii ATCC 25827 TaxID=471874 RepID=A0AA86YN29_PROST|nr:hypothetical protein PROSTU_03125 [Providencia stuartii ATCC 25827]BBV09099.1 hypothetical protein BML2537_25930 [Providencia stuartii]GHB84440.1 hypothetical protein GCM10007290_06140 [Providencia thailandensis]
MPIILINLKLSVVNSGCFGGKNRNYGQIMARNKKIVSNCKIDDEIGCIEIKIHKFPWNFNRN